MLATQISYFRPPFVPRRGAGRSNRKCEIFSLSASAQPMFSVHKKPDTLASSVRGPKYSGFYLWGLLPKTEHTFFRLFGSPFVAFLDSLFKITLELHVCRLTVAGKMNKQSFRLVGFPFCRLLGSLFGIILKFHVCRLTYSKTILSHLFD